MQSGCPGRISMKMPWETLQAVLGVGCGMLVVPSHALDLNGVWAADGSA
jgi:hypothetical protein